MLKIITKNKHSINNLTEKQVITIELESHWRRELNNSQCVIEFKDERGNIVHSEEYHVTPEESQAVFNYLHTMNSETTPVDIWWKVLEDKVIDILGNVEYIRI